MTKPLPKPGEVSPIAPRVIEKFEVTQNEWFLVREDGLWHVKEGKKDSADIYTRLTLEPFRVTRRLVPIEGEDQRGLLVRIGEREVAVPRARIASETDIAKWLADHGVLFDSRQTGLIRLYFSIANANVLLAYTRNGWQVDGAFVAGDQIIGSRGGGRVMHTDSVVSKFERAGTYEQWREEVLPLANWKPGWIFGILAGLSSPLLHRTNISTGCIFNLYGRSSIGKTVALQAAANVWGKPDATGCLKSFSTTINAIEGLAESSSDLGLTLDEMKKASSEVVRESIYSLTNGIGKSRMKSNQDMHRLRHWRVNTMVSSEKTIEGIFDAAGQKQAAGQVVRSIDVEGEPLLPNLPLDQVREFEEALLKCYGVAGPEFVERLMALPEHVPEQMVNEATQSLYPGEDGRLQRTARSFALLIVAGEIMDIETAAVREAFDAWLETGVDAALDDDVMILRDLVRHVDANMGSTILPLYDGDDDLEDGEGKVRGSGEAGFSFRERQGWYYGEDDQMIVWLLPAAVDRLCDGHSKAAFHRFLAKHEIVKMASNGRYTTRVPKLKKQTYALAIRWEKARAVMDELVKT